MPRSVPNLNKRQGGHTTAICRCPRCNTMTAQIRFTKDLGQGNISNIKEFRQCTTCGAVIEVTMNGWSNRLIPHPGYWLPPRIHWERPKV